METLWEHYLNYLIRRCRLTKYEEYRNVFRILHNIEFTYSIQRDDNREADGMGWRRYHRIPKRYLKYEEEFQNHWCSVFEMLVGLAIRVEGEIIGDPRDEHPEYFLIDMIKNLDLQRFVNKEPYLIEIPIRRIVDRWLRREFQEDGYGSPFPLRNPTCDQRKREIWDQMNAYVSENYV